MQFLRVKRDKKEDVSGMSNDIWAGGGGGTIVNMALEVFIKVQQNDRLF